MHPEPAGGSAPPPHPGLTVRGRLLPGLGPSDSRQAARELGVARRTLHRLLAGAMGVSRGLAMRLAQLSCAPAGHRSSRQQAHDLWHTEHALAGVARRILARALPGPLPQGLGAAPHG